MINDLHVWSNWISKFKLEYNKKKQRLFEKL